MPRFLQTLLADDSSDLRLTCHDFNSLRNLADELSRVRQDNDLHLIDTWVDSHETWYDESTCLAAAIHGLERIVFALVVHNMRNGLGLNDRWLEHVQLGEARLDVSRNLKCLPSGLAGLQVLHYILVLDLSHTSDDEITTSFALLFFFWVGYVGLRNLSGRGLLGRGTILLLICCCFNHFRVSTKSIL